MTDAELERLAVWAQRHNPDRERQVHRFYAGCPWCQSYSDPEPFEGYDGGGSHSLGLALIEEVQRLRTLVAAMAIEGKP
jgi:hypothetical protein